MASTSYKSRVIFKKVTDSETGWEGTYKLLLPAESIPAPKQAPNTVEATSLEDAAQVLLKGIAQQSAMELTGLLESSYMEAIDEIGNDQVDVIFLFGSDGLGGYGKWAFKAQISATPAGAEGVDSALKMTVTLFPNTVPDPIKNTITEASGTFTVASAS